MGVWEEHGLTKYPDYFNTPHWRKLKEKHILRNPNAHCFICQKKVRLFWNEKQNREVSNLLIHHISYANLFSEKLMRDIYVLCFDCHTSAHFWTVIKLKVPLTTNWLLFSLRMRRVIYYLQHRQFRLSLLLFHVYLITAFFHSFFWGLKKISVVAFYAFKKLVKILDVAFDY